MASVLVAVRLPKYYNFNVRAMEFVRFSVSNDTQYLGYESGELGGPHTEEISFMKPIS